MIQDKGSIIKIINSINGKFRTPKIKALYDMIDYLNFKGQDIMKLPLDTSPLVSNAWLAGFIDSDGSFMIKGFPVSDSINKGLRSYIALQFYLPQRIQDVSGESLEPVMQNIADFLQVKLNNRDFKGKFHQYIVNTSNNQSNLILINYLNTFHLLSSKYLDYKDWEKAYNLFSKKLYKNPVHYEEIRELKFNMNKNRTSFSWSHHKTNVYDIKNLSL
uniref:LAGLIDADG endonuclease n=1 Tax=Pestalotiopsis fici TaxID=393283 RepID=A0A1D8RE52_9PEZI|nr:LAGLIDADG endonuclease [Pestalotiopsis fici]AOW71174.1 LAGLIDADG endonuclease [Pestalotiopsis fici]